MTAPLSHPVIPAAEAPRETANHPESSPADVYVDLDFLDGNKIASGTPYRLSTDAWR